MVGLILAATDEAEKMGENFGRMLWPTIAIAALLMCGKTLKDPESKTNKKCVISTCLGWVAVLIIFISSMVPDGEYKFLVSIFAALVCGVLLVVSACLAVIGLIELRSQPEMKGKRHAYGSLILLVVFGGLFMAGVVVGFMKHQRVPPALVKQTLSKPVIELKEFNLKVKTPAKPWVEVEAKKLNPVAALAFARTRPQLYAAVIGEKPGIESGIDLKAYVNAVKLNMTTAAPNASFSGEKAHNVAGIAGQLIQVDASLNNINLSYTFWVGTKNGYCYQILAWGQTKKKAMVHAEALKLFAGMQQIDPSQVVHTEGFKGITTYTSPTYPYSLDLAGTAWSFWPDCNTDTPDAEYGGTLKNAVFFTCSPFFHLTEGDVLEEQIKHVLSEREFDYSKTKVLDESSTNGVRSKLITLDYTIDKVTYVYFWKSWAIDKFGLTCMMWAQKSDTAAQKRAMDLFSAIKIDPKGSTALDQIKPESQRAAPQADLFNNTGLTYHGKKDYAKAYPCFEQAFKICPTNATYLVNALNTLNTLKRYKEGAKLVDAHGQKVSTNPEVMAWHAWMLAQGGMPARALEVYAKLFAGEYRGDEDLCTYANLLINAKKWSDAEALFSRYTKTKATAAVWIKWAEIHKTQKEMDKAIAILRQGMKQLDSNAEIGSTLADLLDELSRPKELLKLCDDMIAKKRNPPLFHYYAGLAYERLRWYKKSKASFEVAAKEWPDNQEVQAALKRVSSLLGEGDNSQVKDPITPVPLPKLISDRLPPATAKTETTGYAVCYLSRIVGYSWSKDGRLTRTHRNRIRVLDTAGITRFSTLTAAFSPVSQKLFVNELTVRDRHGKIVAKGDVSDYFVVDRQNNDMATHERTLNVPVPSLAPGRLIEFTYTIQEKGRCDQFPFSKRFMGTSYPILVSAVYVTSSNRQVDSASFNCPAPAAIPNGKAWVVENPKIYRWEPFQAPLDSFYPLVVLSSSKENWVQGGDSYLTQIKNHLKPDATITALGRKICSGLKTDKEKVAALAQYVQANCTYKAVEFGTRGRMPNTAGQTYAKKYGDCKDHSVFLKVLLEVVGIRSQLALVNTSGKVREKLPTLDQFNHMILYVPGHTPSPFIDTTSKSSRLGAYSPSSVAGKKAFILEPGKSRFVDIPSYRIANYRMDIKRDVQVNSAKRVSVSETIVLKGYAGEFMRAELKDVEVAHRLQWCQQLADGYMNAVEIKAFKVENLTENNKDLLLKLTYTWAVPAQSTAKRIQRLQCIWEAYYCGVRKVTRRSSPYQVLYPMDFNAETTVHFANNALRNEYAFPQKHTLSAADKSWIWKRDVSRVGQAWKVHFSCRWNAGTFKDRDYLTFQDGMQKAVASAYEILTSAEK